MTKNQVKLLRLLKKHGTMTAPQICKKLNIKKSNIYATDYSELIQYINFPGEDPDFDSYFNIKHYAGDEATSCKSEFSLTVDGEKILNNRRKNLFNSFIAITSLIVSTIALIFAILQYYSQL